MPTISKTAKNDTKPAGGVCLKADFWLYGWDGLVAFYL